MVQELEYLCLRKIRTELDSFSVYHLSLLPHHLRQILLRGLPVADICKLEKSSLFTNGVDMTLVWKNVLKFIRKLLADLYNCRFKPLLQSLSDKDKVVAILGNVCATEVNDWREGSKPRRWTQIVATLFAYSSYEAFFQDEGALEVSVSSYESVRVPSRYTDRIDKGALNRSQSLANVLNTFGSGPKVMFTLRDVIDEDFLSIDSQQLQSFLSRVEVYDIEFTNDYMLQSSCYVDLLEKITLSQSSDELGGVTPLDSPLHTLRLSGFHTDIEYSVGKLEHLLSYQEWAKSAQKQRPYIMLKEVELATDDRDNQLIEHSHACRLCSCCDSIAKILYCQEALEVVCLKGLSSLEILGRSHPTHVYTGFESLYFFLPLIIARPCFRSLKLDECKIPINAIENIIHTFLCTPTAHAQSLDLCGCTAYGAEPISLPEGCPPCPTIPDDAPCVDTNLKSLSLFINNGLSNFKWLLNYPNMKLQRLNLTCNPAREDEKTLQGYQSEEKEESKECIEEGFDSDEQKLVTKCLKVDRSHDPPTDDLQRLCEFICKLPQPEELHLCFTSLDVISVHGCQGIKTVCSLPTLTSLCIKYSEWGVAEPYNIVSVIATAISENAPKGKMNSLQSLKFSSMMDVCSLNNTKLLLNSVLLLPQLPNFTLELSETYKVDLHSFSRAKDYVQNLLSEGSHSLSGNNYDDSNSDGDSDSDSSSY